MKGFKLPQNFPQDLLLICDIVGVPADAPPLSPGIPAVVQTDDGIDSSDSEIASEDEIEAELIPVNYADDLQRHKAIPASSDSDSDSDSGSEPNVIDDDDTKSVSNHGVDEEDELGTSPATGTYFRTKNEINETDVTIPDIAEVGPEEVLEKVGEIMGVMENLVIVKGAPSELVNQGSERALDSDTLLVFEDRKVMGYVYETFGPTSQPLYQVKFNNSYPLDHEKMRISRNVFHVPKRSRFVFLNRIKQMKGSDASNVHDEEPADHELEFSDDEAEAAFKSSLKRKRTNSRAQSVTSSRHNTPSPSQMRDQDLLDDVILEGNAYDEHGPYDLDFNAGPSRPPPIPYDDPYADEYPPAASVSTIPSWSASSPSPNHSEHRTSVHGTRHDRAHEQGLGRGRGRGWGRGRGRENDRLRSGRQIRADSTRSQRSNSASETSWDVARSPDASYDPPIPRPLSPTSLTIAHATGQLPDGLNMSMPHLHVNNETWSYQDTRFHQGTSLHFYTQGFPPPFVQPHINPRFASAFGLHMNMNMGLIQPQQNDIYERTNLHSISPLQTSDQTDQWAVPTGAIDEVGVDNDVA